MTLTTAVEDNAWMLAAATCTEEKFTWAPPGRIVGVCVSGTWTNSPDDTRVALFPGSRTVVTDLNLENFRLDHMPSLVDVDFTIPGLALFDRMVELEHQKETYMTVRNGVAPACIHALCNTSYIRLAETQTHTRSDPAYAHFQSYMYYAGDHDQRRQPHHGTGQGAQSAVRETVLTD